MNAGYYKNKSENVKVSLIISYLVPRILNLPLYGFPLSRNFHVCTHVNFTCVKYRQYMNGRAYLRLRVIFHSMHCLYFFSRVKLTCVRLYARESYAKVDIHLDALQGSNFLLLITRNLSSVMC